MDIICIYCESSIFIEKKDLNTQVECPNCKKAFVLNKETIEKVCIILLKKNNSAMNHLLKSDYQKIVESIDSEFLKNT
jgi:hypothetical protein